MGKEQDNGQIQFFTRDEVHQSGEGIPHLSNSALIMMPPPALSTQHSALSTAFETPQTQPFISVVVPTYKRPELLMRCLSALWGQTLEAREYEIIVVDDGPTAEARTVVEQWRHRAGPTVTYLTVAGHHGPAAARSVGWRAARGSIIAFTDDDCLPSPGWLAAGLRCFDREGVAGAWGRIVVPLPPIPTDYQKSVAGLEHAPLATANCFYRREVLEEVGGFDERFTQAWREDSDLQFSVLKRGYRCIPQPDAVVIHPVRPARWGVSLRLQRNSAFNALLFKKHPILYRQYIQGRPPWNYYVAVLALIATVVAAMGGWWSLVVVAGFLWVGVTAQFCRCRLNGTSRRLDHVVEMIVTSALIPPLAVFWRLYGALKYRVAFL